MKQKIAIPVNNGELSEHFGHCSHFVLFTVENKQIIEEELLESPPHQPGLLPPWLAEKGATDIIAGGMGNRAVQLFNQHKVNVFVGAPKKQAKDLIMGFLDGTLSFSANYCDH